MKKKELVLAFESEEFREYWELWLSYRKEIKKPIKGLIASQGQMNKLARLSKGEEQTAIDIIMQSIENNWRGLFTLKTETNGQQAISNEEQQLSNRSAVEQLLRKRKERQTST
jgi:hypothetical protein